MCVCVRVCVYVCVCVQAPGRIRPAHQHTKESHTGENLKYTHMHDTCGASVSPVPGMQ